MPTYEYQCDACHRVFEVRQRITEEPLKTCDVCGGAVRRLLSAAPFILKGEGWYVTDYPSESRKKAMKSEKSSSDTGTKSDGAKSDGAKTDGAKSDGAKSESKSDAKSDSSSSAPGSTSSGASSSSAASKSD